MARGFRNGLRLARKAYRKVHPDPPFNSYDAVEVTGQEASDLIKERLLNDAPTMIARLGSVELECVRTYLGVHGQASLLRRSLDFVRGRGGRPWWEAGDLTDLAKNAGFFPEDFELAERFCSLMLHDLQLIDVLGSWLSWERVVAPCLADATRVRLSDLEPYYHVDPWSEALAGRTVLVVHPFAATIESQYARRAQLFDDPRVLPAFELKTLRAVQSHAGGATTFRTWFDALEHMRAEISATQFDIAIIGAGAYGLPLAAHVKRTGRKAVHLGGAVQILFGIKGRRWDDHAVISQLYNEHWVRPAPEETPARFEVVERGAYW